MPLADPSLLTLEERWKIAQPVYDFARLWAVFFEAYSSNHQLLGFFQLKVSPEEFRAYYRQLIDRGWYRTSR